jgi:predicted Zn-dependent protease
MRCVRCFLDGFFPCFGLREGMCGAGARKVHKRAAEVFTMLIKATRTAALGIILTLALGCASGSTGGVSLQDEWQLGNQMAAQVEQQYKLVRDPAALAYVRSVGEKIHAHTPMASLPFDYEIVDDPAINAFSLPGGHVYVNTGLIGAASKADELAGVLAHETAHVTQRHVVKQLVQQQQINTLGSILLGQNPGGLQTLLAQVVAGGAMARFSRADEKEADDRGLEFMQAAGYDPHGMLDMFLRLQQEEKSRPGAVERFFADHPMTQDRINDIQKRVGNASGVRDEPGFQETKQRVGK